MAWLSQYPLFGYIVDFYAPHYRVAVEVDGGVHQDQIDYDVKRDRQLADRDIVVLRFTNEQVLADPLGVTETIMTAVQDRPLVNSYVGRQREAPRGGTRGAFVERGASLRVRRGSG